MVNLIKFYPKDTDAAHWTLPPVAAFTQTPDWYRSMNRYSGDGKTAITSDNNYNLTIKSCIPFLDTITAGYSILLSADVLVRQTDNGPYMQWRADEDMVLTHSQNQIKGLPVPEGMAPVPFKWKNFYEIETPRGWSLLFTHPMQRSDLPFITISGVVDTDKYTLPVHLPFFMSKTFEGTLKRGTPIAQIIPIKRETWKSEIKESKNNYLVRMKKLHAYIEKYYKLNAWSYKEYR